MTAIEEEMMLKEFLNISDRYRFFLAKLEAQYGCLLQALPGSRTRDSISISNIKYNTAMLDDAVRKAIFEMNKEVK